MTMKIMTMLPVLLTAFVGAAQIEVSGLKAVQRYPWNGLVDIDFTLQCDEADARATLMLNVTCENGRRTVPVRHVWLEDRGTRSDQNPIVVAPGDHRLVWDAGADMTNAIASEVTVTLDAVVGSGKYLVVDLSGGAEAASWPVSYLAEVPAGGWSREDKTERMVFALVPGGSFSMGSPESELGRSWDYDESQHSVTLTKSFYAAVFEVTQRQYFLMTGEEPSGADPLDDRPVDSVSWHEAEAALAVLGEKTGLDFRLPTEAEWEYACRGGTATALYDGSNLTDAYCDEKLDELANYNGSNLWEPTSVGSFAPNGYRLYDMLGNVREWCLDGFGAYPPVAPGETATDPCQPDVQDYGRVLRGGDWCSWADECRSAARSWSDPADALDTVGFRAFLTGSSDGSSSVREEATIARLDTRASPRYVSVGTVHEITYSPTWKAGGSKCAVTGLKEVATTTESGSVEWTAVEGYGSLTFSIDSERFYSAEFSVVPVNAEAVNVPVVTNSQTVAAGRTWVVTAPLTIARGVTVTLEPGAVMKIASGVTVKVEEGGKLVLAGEAGRPVVITHINDDTAGARIQTDPDGRDRPAYGAYEIVGELVDNDHTEYRYVAARPLPAKITADTILRHGRVYTVESNATVEVQGGATLTIQPGVAIKFGAKAGLLVKGTLVAQGTAAENVVFTALADDDCQGDTDGDFGRNRPNAGAWDHIEIVGSASFDHCRILYASDTTDEGAIHVVGGGAVFNNGEIAHAEYECVRVNSGTFSSRNSVFRDAAIAFGYYGGSGVYVRNGVVADVTEASRGINKHFYNTVFYRCLKFVGAGSGNSCSYCVFFNPEGYVAQSAEEWTGNEGNHCLWGDPRFVDNGLTPYALATGSACIDAADGGEAPEFDAFDRPRMNVLDEERRHGKQDREGYWPDVGVFEADGAAASKANLSIGSLVVPAEACVGSPMTVTYVVANASAANLKPNAAYRDTVSFVSADGTATIEAKSFNTEVGADGFPAGQEREFVRSVQVPVLLGGDWSVRVVVNSARDLVESSYDDNVKVSEGYVHVSMAGNPLTEKSAAGVSAGRPVMFKFENDSTAKILEITAPEGATVRYGVGFNPSAQSFSGSAVIGSEGGSTIVSLPPGKTVYVSVESDRAGVVEANPVHAAMRIHAVSPELVKNDRVSLVLDGQLFGEDAVVVVSNRDHSVRAEAVQRISSERLVATCDLSDFETGSAVVDLTCGGFNDCGAVMVSEEVEDPDLEVVVEMPDSLRQGRSFTFRVNYRNTGGADMPSPIIRINSPALVFRTEYGSYPGTIKLVGLGDRGEDGVLRPGATYGLDVMATVTTDISSADQVVYTVVPLTKRTAGAAGALPSSHFLSSEVDSADARQVSARLGDTWSEFFGRFSEFLAARGAYGLAVADFEVMAHDYARHLLAEVRSPGAPDERELISCVRPLEGADASEFGLEVRPWSERACGSSGSLRRRTAANLEVARGDNSPDGTLWLYRGGAWVRMLKSGDNLSGLFDRSRPIVVIAHDKLESIHSARVQRLASAIDETGLWPDGEKANVIAVDWGEAANSDATDEELAKMYDIASGSAAEFSWMGVISPALRARLGEVEFGFASARRVPSIADGVHESLKTIAGQLTGESKLDPAKAVFIGCGQGAQLLGAVAAKCAEDGIVGKIGRLVLLEPSGDGQFAFAAARDRYPAAWNRDSAAVTESYKTTPWASAGASVGEGEAQVFGRFNFNVVPTLDAGGRTAYFDGRGIRADNGMIAGKGMLGYLLHADADTIESRNSQARSADCVRWFVDTVRNCGSDFEFGGWCGVGWSWMPEGSPAKFALPHEGYHRALTNYPRAFHALIRERGRVIELLRPLELGDNGFEPWKD